MARKIRGIDYIKSLLKEEGFIESIKQAKASDEFTRQVMPGRVLLDHGIPTRFWKMVDHYIDTGEIDEKLIGDPVSVVSTDRGVVLKLSHDITQPELRAYIDKHWQSDIKLKLELLTGERRRRLTTQRYPDRDRRVYADFSNKANNGLTNEAIAEKHGIDVRTVRRIVDKFK
jgi:hypothetical protein